MVNFKIPEIHATEVYIVPFSDAAATRRMTEANSRKRAPIRAWHCEPAPRIKSTGVRGVPLKYLPSSCREKVDP